MEPPPPLPTYIPHNSKKRVFPRGSSSSYMDSEVGEMSQVTYSSSNSESLHLKEVIHHEVIDVDMDEDSGDVMLIDGKADTNNKGKETLANFLFGSVGANLESVDGVQSSKKSCASGSQKSINVDGLISDLSYCDDEYMDMYYDDLIYDDHYTILQSRFDKIDIPPGVEAPIPWLPDLAKNENNSAMSSTSTHSSSGIQSVAPGFPSDSSKPLWLPESDQPRKRSTSKSSSRQLTPVAEPALSKKNLGASSSTYTSSQTQRGAVNLPYGLKPFKPWHLHDSFQKIKNSSVSGGTTFYTSHDQLGDMQLSPGIDPISGPFFPNSTKDQIDGGNLYSTSYMPLDLDAINPPTGKNISMSKWLDSQIYMKKLLLSDEPPPADIFDAGDIFLDEESYTPWDQDPAKSKMKASDVGSSVILSGSRFNIEKYGSEDEIKKKFQLFKRFDTVQDYSDHHYSCSGSSLRQPSKNWAKKIQEEWKILEKDLPDTIFVRVYESRMDLLRAVIVGAEGTPYHDGLFFFDVFFPSSYPDVPPHVYYHSGGLRINPNLYNCGKVCLSLLNTWSGDQNEKWIPGVSTMLQVLVSIQGLILNTKPFFNEPGYENLNGSAQGERSSLQYNENTFILSLKTIVYTLRRPPQHFEDFVVGHFCKQGHDILVACKAYMDGAQVGSLVRGGVQDVDEGDKSCSHRFNVDEGDKSCSHRFKRTLAVYISMLVQAFIQVGAKDCEKFLSLAHMENTLDSPAPKDAAARSVLSEL